MIVEEKPQLTKDREPQPKEKEQTQIEVNEKTWLNRRTLIIIGIALAVVVLLLAVTTINFLSLNFICPWKIESCNDLNVLEYKQNYWPWSPCLPCP